MLVYNTTVEEEFLTPKDVARILKISYMTVYRWIQAGKLKAYQVEKQFRIKKTDFDEFVERYPSR